MKKQILTLMVALSATACFAQPPAGYVSLDEYQANSDIQKNGEFLALKGVSLKDTMTAWAKQAGWDEFVWKMPADFDPVLGGSASFKGDLNEVFLQLLKSVKLADSLSITYFKGNSTVVVEVRQ